jgi:hypothetical protein
MSEVHSRIPYTPRGGGRGASRGGRSGSTGTRGGSARSVRNLNGDINTPYSNEDEGQLKTKYPKALLQLEEMFENQASEDLISILEECDGDPNIAADRLAEGPFSYLQALLLHVHYLPAALRLLLCNLV